MLTLEHSLWFEQSSSEASKGEDIVISGCELEQDSDVGPRLMAKTPVPDWHGTCKSQVGSRIQVSVWEVACELWG